LRVRQCGQPSFCEQKNSVPCPSAQPPEGLPHRRLTQQRLHAFETGLQQRGVRLVEKIADVIVGGNTADAEQGLAVGAAMAFLEAALIGQKRRALHEEHRERRKTEIGGRNVAGPPLAQVGKSRADGLQLGEKRWQEQHPNPESDFC
jgi:hypothetical protein